MHKTVFLLSLFFYSFFLDALFGQELPKCAEVMAVELQSNAHSYITNRGLTGPESGRERGYFFQLDGLDFLSTILDLKEGDIYLDAGSGALNSIREYYHIGGKADTVGLSFESLKDLGKMDHFLENYKFLSSMHTKSFDLLSGVYAEQMEIPEGSISVISDVHGPLTYTLAVDVVLRNYLQALKLGGSIFVAVSSMPKILKREDELMEREKVVLELQKENPFTQTAYFEHTEPSGFEYLLSKARGIRAEFSKNPSVFKITKTSSEVYIPDLIYDTTRSGGYGYRFNKFYSLK